MTRARRFIAKGAAVAIALAGTGNIFATVEAGPAESNVPLPEIARGRGDACVEEVDFMRRNHMNVLRHKRDQTMHEGIRSRQYSLKECLSCHAVEGPDAQPVSIASSQHFCRSCHDYAAVSIDCFGCHASRPEGEIMAASGVAELGQ